MIDKDDPKLLQFVLGELPEEEQATIQKQVDGSPELQIAVEEIREVTKLLERNFESEPLPSLLAQQVETIEAATHASASKSDSSEGKPASNESKSPKGPAKVQLQKQSDVAADPYNSDSNFRVPYKPLAIGGVLSLLILFGVIGIMVSSGNRNYKDVAHNAMHEDKKSAAKSEKNEGNPQPTSIHAFRFKTELEDRQMIPSNSTLDEIVSDARNAVAPGDDDNVRLIISGGMSSGRQLSSGGGSGSMVPGQGRADVESLEFSVNNPESKGFERDRVTQYGVDSFGVPNLAQAGEKENFSEAEQQKIKAMFGRDGDGRRSDEDGLEEEQDLGFAGFESGKNSGGGDGQSGAAADGYLESMKLKGIAELAKSIDKLESEQQVLPIRLVQLRSKAVEGLLESELDISNLEIVDFKENAPLQLKGKDEDVARVKELIEKIESSNHKELNEKEVLLAKLMKKGTNKKNKSWKKVKAVPNTSRLMVGDKDELDLRGIQANVRVEGYRARVLLDCFYYNDRARNLEGTFKIRLPDDSSLFYFAFGESVYNYTPKQMDLTQREFQNSGKLLNVSYVPEEINTARKDDWRNVKEARCAEKQKAAFAYTQTVKRRVDPALVEWAGAGVFNARVFPLTAKKMHRIVIGYDLDLRESGGKMKYAFAVPEGVAQSSVNIQVARTEDIRVDSNMDTKPLVDPEVFQYSFKNLKKQIELDIEFSDATLLKSPKNEFFATRVTPLKELAKSESNSASRAVFLLDTSLSSQPQKFNVWLKMLQRVLNKNRDQIKEFAVLNFNVENYWWKEEFTANTKENVSALIKDCEKLSLEGATDLHSAIARVNNTEWLKEAKDLDCFLLSDGAATWGERHIMAIQNEFVKVKGRRLIAYQSGLTGTAIGTLRNLAQVTGGAVFSVVNEAEVAKAAVAHRSRPWRLESVELDGAEDVLTAGRVQWIYPGQSVAIAGRGNPSGNVVFNLSQNDKKKKARIALSHTIKSTIARRTYGQIAVGQLESLGDLEKRAAVAYARSFRVPGQNCSMIMLESEQEYKRFNLNPEDDPIVVKTTRVSSLVSNGLKSIDNRSLSAKRNVEAWVEQLGKNSPGQKLNLSPAMEFVIRDASNDDFLIQPEVLNCKYRTTPNRDFKLNWGIQAEKLTPATLGPISIRLQSEGAPTHDRVRALSNFVESNPGNIKLGKSVAQKLMDLEMPGHSFYLLRDNVMARPFDSDNYLAMGNCLFQLKKYAYGMLCYEIAMNSRFTNNKGDFKKIVAHDYARLLKKVIADERKPSLVNFAEVRLEEFQKTYKIEEFDLAIKLTWNTDSTDIDLHVIEPSGEKCYYQNTDTRSGGHLTSDITDGFGPELYTLKKAPRGKYQIKVEYFGENRNRLTSGAQATIEVIQNYGRSNEKVTRKSVELKSEKALIDVMTVGLK